MDRIYDGMICWLVKNTYRTEGYLRNMSERDLYHYYLECKYPIN